MLECFLFGMRCCCITLEGREVECHVLVGEFLVIETSLQVRNSGTLVASIGFSASAIATSNLNVCCSSTTTTKKYM